MASKVSQFFFKNKKRAKTTSSGKSTTVTATATDSITNTNCNSLSNKGSAVSAPQRKKRRIINKVLCLGNDGYETDPDYIYTDTDTEDEKSSLLSAISASSNLSKLPSDSKTKTIPTQNMNEEVQNLPRPEPVAASGTPSSAAAAVVNIDIDVQASGVSCETEKTRVATGDSEKCTDAEKSKVWNFFDAPVVSGSGKKLKKTVKCNLCRREFAYCQTTSNSRNHLKTKHVSVWMEHFAEKTELTEKDIGKLPEQSTRSKISDFLKGVNYYKKNSTTKRKLDRLLGSMIVQDYQPLSIVENKGFQEFVAGLNPRYQIPSRRKVTTKVLPKMYAEAKDNLKQALEKAQSVAITTDTWTSVSNESFLGVTCHFFVDDNLEVDSCGTLYSTTLDVIPILKDEKSQTLADIITETLTEWNIFYKLNAVVTDNAANMKAAVDLLPSRVKHFPCFAHTVNLVVKNSISKDPTIHRIVSKVKDIVTFFHHSPKAERILEGHNQTLLEPGERKPIKLVQSVDTRWNSVVAMLSSFIENWNGVKLVACNDQYRESFVLLSSAEINIIKEIIVILDVFQSLTEVVSGDTYVTISLIIPSITGLYYQLNEIEKGLKSSESKSFLNVVRCVANEKLDLYEDRTLCRMSTLLDPRFKKNGFRTAGVDEGEKGIQSEIKKFIKDVPQQRQEQPKSSSSQPRTKNKKSVLDYVPDVSPLTSTATADGIVLTRNYLTAPRLDRISSMQEILIHLKRRHPEIYQLALGYLCIPGSSVPCERLFSSTGNLITDKRNRLSRENIATLTFLHYNHKLVDK